MPNPLEKAVKSALRSNNDIGTLFARIGNNEHPRGFVTSAYRQAKRAMRSAMTEENQVLAAADVMAELKRTLRGQLVSLALDAQAQGAEEAARQLSFYDITSARALPAELSTTATASISTALARVDAQSAAVQALILSGAAIEQIVGTEERAGALRVTDVASYSAEFAAGLVWASFGEWVAQQARLMTFQKQVVAALDNRTTDCCLKAHAQIQPMNKKFQLTGTPRYADELEWAPFHWYAIVSGEMCVTARGNVPIENIRIGDMVLTHKGRYKPVTLALSRKFTGTGLLIETTGGKIKITPEHPVLTARGWVKAGKLLEGDVIFGKKNSGQLTGFGTELIEPSARNNSDHADSFSAKKNILKSVPVPRLGFTMAPIVNFNTKLNLWKIKIENVFSDRALKLKVETNIKATISKLFKHDVFEDGRVLFISIRDSLSSFFGNALHTKRIVFLHPFRSNRISNTNPRMSIFLPFSNGRLAQISPLYASFNQPALDNISGNTKIFSDGVLRISSVIRVDDVGKVNDSSSWHDRDLLYNYYIVKNISTLELSDATICDLSVQDDESYCIADHFVHNCRSSIALYLEQYDIGVTQDMRTGARQIINEREVFNVRRERFPVDARG